MTNEQLRAFIKANGHNGHKPTATTTSTLGDRLLRTATEARVRRAIEAEMRVADGYPRGWKEFLFGSKEPHLNTIEEKEIN